MANETLAGLTIDLPQGWEVATMAAVAPIPKVAPGLLTAVQQTNFRDTVVLARESVPPNTSAETYVRAQMKGSNTPILELEERIHHGEPALLTEVRPVGPSGEKLIQLQLTVARPKEVWIVIVTTLDGAHAPKQRAELMRIIESVKFP